MKLYYVIYRIGGTENFEWRRSVPMSKKEAEKSADDVRKGGRKAMIVEQKASDAIGLPGTYEYKRPE